MGFRSRKSFKIAPGVKLNVGKKSVGVSVGGKHGGISVNSKTEARARISAPGTGLSYTTKIGSSPSKNKPVKKTASQNIQQKHAPVSSSAEQIAKYEDIIKKGNLTKKKTKSLQKGCTITALSLILAGLLTVSYGILGFIFIVLGIIFACIAHTYKNIVKTCFNNTPEHK